MRCFVCQAELKSSNMLVRHLRLVHGYVPGRNLRLKCVQTGCGSVFGTFSGFRKHLNTKHTEYLDQQAETDVTLNGAVEVVASNVDETPTSSEPSINSEKSTLDMCASAVAQLKAAGLSQSTVNSFVSSMEEVFFEINSQAKDAALQCLSPQDTENKNKIEESFKQLENGNPFTCLNTETKRNKHFKEKWGNVEPVEKVLGTRFDSRRNKSTGTYDQVIITDKFSYVPILETLKNILDNPELTNLFKPRHIPKEGVYTDIRDANYFKENLLFSKENDAL